VARFRTEVPGVEFVEPHGAFYFFFRVDGIRDGMTGSKFCEELMQREGVALVPGAAFGDDRWVRLSMPRPRRSRARSTASQFRQQLGD
jgi:aspartate aminotransferase